MFFIKNTQLRGYMLMLHTNAWESWTPPANLL